MQHAQNELIVRNSTKLLQSCMNGIRSAAAESTTENSSDTIGGIIYKGQLGWLVEGALLEIYSLRSGRKVSSFRFDCNLGFGNSVITCISEISATGINCCILAVGVLFGDATGGSVVAIYSVEESKVLRCIELKDKITSCQFIASEISKRTILHMMQGCLAVGTDNGKLFLLDLNLLKCEAVLFSTKESNEDIELFPCHIVSSNLEFSHIRQHHKHSKQENINFAIELERVENAGLILSILSLTPLLALAVGLEDGRMILYDLSELQPFHMAYPPKNSSPLVKLAFLEAPDDPRACIYVWAFHENPETPIAVMHSLMYDKKITEDDGISLYEGFQSCNVRLTLPMYERGSLPVACQSVKRVPSLDDDEILSICLLAWKSNTKSHIMIFDINQWYKEEMPSIGDWRDDLNYLAHFEMRDYSPLDVYIESNKLASFNSINRPEEHFYPISFCFDATILQIKESTQIHWPGLQNRALNLLRLGGASAILEPTAYFNEIMKATLVPQFTEYNYNSQLSIRAQRDVLLSIALEYNCFGLLKECARNWADGSHLGKNPDEALSLSTLTDWIWTKARNIKNRCNILSVPLFDHSGLPIDRRTQKELSHLNRQLKLLTDLFDFILTKCKEYIPNSEFEIFTSQFNSIRMSSEYQEVLQWLLNIGLLPEGVSTASNDEDDRNYSQIHLVPYPYKILKSYYMNQRMRFAKLNKGFISSITQSCRLLYIDSFIEHECNANVLRDHWQESGGNGLYPPPSLQAMLRTLLVPDVSIEKKYTLFIYLFLDLNMAVDDERYAPIVHNLIKFPAVFKLNASLIKTVQAFWNLDHGLFEIALEEMISPFSQDHKLSQWQQDLLIESLLAQDQSKLALQALQAQVSPVSSLLELKTLLANDLIAEAYHLQRSKNDPELLQTFLNGCLCLGKWSVLRDLALTEDESRFVEEFLRHIKSSKADNLHFIYLLQRSKYIEAISYLEELSKSKQNRQAVDLETPNLVLSAYDLTLTPATKQFSNVYCNIRNRLKPEINNTQSTSPIPLSSELLRNGIKDLAGGIYHSSALSTDQATFYWDENLEEETNRLRDVNNVPFIRQPQLQRGDFSVKESLSYPEVFKGASKRRLNESDLDDEEYFNDSENPQKKRCVLIDDNEKISISQRPFKTITRFKDKNSNKNLSIRDKTLNESCFRQNSGEKTPHLLSTPIIKSRRIELKDEMDTIDSNFERVCTPQSILKVKSMTRPTSSLIDRRNSKDTEIEESKTIATVHQNNVTLEEQEKSIHFQLPGKSGVMDSSYSSSPFDTSKNESNRISSLRFSGPQKRRGLRSPNTSAITVTSDTDEFFSPTQSKDNSKIDEDIENQSEEDTSMIRSKEVQEGSDVASVDDGIDDDKEKNVFLEAHPNSPEKIKATKIIIENISVENSPLKRRINLTERPRGRRPLRSAKASSKEGSSEEFESEEIVTLKDAPLNRQTRNRSRSKTPDISMSLTRRSSRIAEKEKIIEPKKPLSRVVLEANAKKVQNADLPDQTSERDPKLYKEKSLKINTIVKQSMSNFSFITSTSKCEKSLIAKDIPKREDKSFDDFSTTVDVCSTTIASLVAPKEILSPDNSALSDSSSKNDVNYALMTTVDMSTFSGDFTMEELKPPGNILSDSEGENTEEDKNEKMDVEITEDNNKEINRLKMEKSQNQIKTDKTTEGTTEEKVEKSNQSSIEGSNQGDDEEPRSKFVDNRNLAPFEESADSESEDSESREEPTGTENDEKYRNEESEEETEEEEELEEEEEEEDGDDLVISISSSSEEVSFNYTENNETEPTTSRTENQKHISEKDENNFDTINILVTTEPSRDSTPVEVTADADISDMLYGDIDSENVINVDQDKDDTDESDEFNDAIIMNKSLSRIVEKPEENVSALNVESRSVGSSKNVQSVSASTDGVIKDIVLAEIPSKCYEIELLKIQPAPGMTMNFLTGEEEKLEETGEFSTVTELNVAHLEKESVAITESEVSYIDTSVSEYKSVAEDKTSISSISAMEMDDDIYESLNSTKDPLNEQILDGTIRASETIIFSDKKEKEKEANIVVKKNEKEATDSSSLNVEDVENVKREKLDQQSDAKFQEIDLSSKMVKTDVELIAPKSLEMKNAEDISIEVKDFSSQATTSGITLNEKLHKSTVENKSNTETLENKSLEKGKSPDRYTPNKAKESSVSASTSGNILRSRRAHSETIEIESQRIEKSEKLSRATSVPRSDKIDNDAPSTPKRLRKTSESSSIRHLTPSRILTRRQSQQAELLEKIEEDDILDSPSTRTRLRKRLASQDTEEHSDQLLLTPTMSSKRNRRSSLSSADTPVRTPSLRGKQILTEENSQSTPRRTKSHISKKLDALETEEISKKSDRRKGKKELTEKTMTKKSESNASDNSSDGSENETSETDDIASRKSSEVSKRSSKKSNSSKISTSKKQKDHEESKGKIEMQETGVPEDFSTSRRMTRNQLSILEKGLSTPPAPEPQRITRRRSSKLDESPLKRSDYEGSDLESMASGRSKQSSIGSKKKTTRSSKKDDQDDTSSIASSTRSHTSVTSKKEKTTKSKKNDLKVIPEEQDVESVGSSEDEEDKVTAENENPLKKRGRPRKSIA